METYAVLTGDIVKSREISSRARLIETLKEALETAKETHHTEYDLYRGDSFQVVVPSAPAAALVAIIIRSKLISHSPKTPILHNYRCIHRYCDVIGVLVYDGE